MVYKYYDDDNFDSIDSKYWGKHGWIFLNILTVTNNVLKSNNYLLEIFIKKRFFLLKFIKIKNNFYYFFCKKFIR